MKKILLVLVQLAVCGNAWAVEPPPVLLIVHNNVGVNTGNGNLGLVGWGISAWANHSVNKQSEVKVARFNAALGGLDFVAEASRALGCVGVNEPCAERSAFTDAAQFDLALANRPGRDGVVVEVTAELIAEQMLVRGVSHAVVLSDKTPGDDKKPKVDQGAGYTAVVTMRVPKELAELKKSKPAELEQYWVAGEPRRIVSDTRRALTELKALFAILASDGSADGKLPEAWEQLPKIKTFYDSGRIKCGGSPCSMTHVLKDNGDSFVLVLGGATAAWLDAPAAAHYSNLFLFALLGLPWK